MGAPVTGIKAAEESSAEVLFSAFNDISGSERRKHATVYNYWLSIRGDRHVPPIRDLDPLEISDAGPTSALLELIGGGEDAEIRHLGQAIKDGVSVERISEAPRPSLLSCIAKQLPIISNARQALAFEDEYVTGGNSTRCWVTLLPFSSTGTYVDYVYGLVSLKADGKAAEAPLEVVPEEPEPEAVAELAPSEGEEALEAALEKAAVEEAFPVAEVVEEAVEETAEEAVAEQYDEPYVEDVYEEAPAPKRPGFSKLFDTLAGKSGFYGNVVQMDPKLPTEPEEFEQVEEPQAFDEAAPVDELELVEDSVAEEPVAETETETEVEAEEIQEVAAAHEEPTEPEIISQPEETRSVPEGNMQTKLAEVRSKADEARAAKLRANAALYAGLSAAYDFALDAEENAEEYLKLVEAQGLKIQLRSPMKPVVKLAFDGMCDDSTISQLETVLAWALKHDLPRGTLAERIEAEGGLGSILNGPTAAAA
jgi:hypothetical protein